MSECQICGSDAAGTDGYRCNHCDDVHCSDHRLPEKHNCAALRVGPVNSPNRGVARKQERRGGDHSSPEPMDVDENRSPSKSSRSGSTGGSPDLNPDGTISGTQSSTLTVDAEGPSVVKRLRNRASGYRWRLRSYRAKAGFFLGAAIVVIGIVNAVTGDGITGLPTMDFYRPLVSYAYKDSLYATGGTQLLADLLFVMIGVVILVRR